MSDEPIPEDGVIRISLEGLDDSLSSDKILDSLNKLQVVLSKSLASMLEAQSQSMEHLSLALDRMGKTVDGWSIQIKTAVMTLSNHGWFFDQRMPLPFLGELGDAFEQGNEQEAEIALTKYFQERLILIEREISECFPQRAKIISAAFKAHKNGVYELSVPVFLAQADGICYEMTEHHVFRQKKKTAAYVKTITSNAIRSALLSPLTNSLPISASEYERDELFDELNRHQVLHGEVVDYGTEINSLKAISLLNYITQVFHFDGDTETA